MSDILQLALRARKYGIFLVIAGQTFRADLIDSAVLGQFSFNVAFRVRSPQVSLSILGETGAEKLRQAGEALVKERYLLPDDIEPIVVRAGSHWDLLMDK